MNILVINVALRPNSRVKLFPVGLGYITTAIKKAGFIFDLLDIDAHRYSDEEIEKFIRKKKYDVICMGCIVTGYKIIKNLSLVIKKYHPYSKIIVGNSVASSISDILLKETKADIAVLGEGDEVIVELLQAINKDKSFDEIKGISFIKNNIIISTEKRPFIKDISLLPFIDYSVWDVDIYINNTPEYIVDSPSLPFPREKARALPVNTARGCPARCSFCYNVFKNYPYRYRGANSIVSEIKDLINKYSLNYILFWDELTFFSKKQTLELVQKIIDENLDFYWEGVCKANLFNDESELEIINKMKESKCNSISYSLESSDPDILKIMNKNISAEQFSKQTQLFHKVGIPTFTSLVFGYPQETPETINKTFDCCIKNKIYPSAGYLLPQPGSKMYEYAINMGFINNQEEYLLALGDRQDLRLNMTNMKNEDFENYVVKGLERCNEILNTGLKSDNLIKTQYYRSHKK